MIECDQIEVTAKEVRLGLKLPKTMQVIEESVLVKYSSGKPAIFLARNYFPASLIEELQRDAFGEDMEGLSSVQHNSRGSYKVVQLGIWQRRGGDYSFHSTPSQKKQEGAEFVKRHSRLWELGVSAIEFIDPGYCKIAHHSKHCMHFGRVFCFGSLNITSTTHVHKDSKDFKWCLLIPIGNFSGGNMLFPYMGISLACTPCDLLLMDSQHLFHVPGPYIETRASFVLTSHYTLVTGHARHLPCTNKHCCT